MPFSLFRVATLLFGSGMCALVYQVTWARELRLVFGNSTAASACVLSIFMGGLGLGSIFLGKYADRHPRPLNLYANLELLIAVFATLSPFLILLVRKSYLSLGGSMVLGMPVAIAVRLALSCVVLGVPTFLMGGTLPAAARAVETDQDSRRRYLALLYGVNTLGAVAGASLSTFWLLEVVGTRSTVWLAAMINVCVAVTARVVAQTMYGGKARTVSQREGRDQADAPRLFEADHRGSQAATPVPYVVIAAAIVGFAFLLMEIVWYRMLSPLLGGSTYSFGLILAVALLGIGAGGAAYASMAQLGRARLTGFALSVGIEAVCMAIPIALGDRIAVLTAGLRTLGSLGFYGYVAGWTLVAALVVLPTAIVSGFQFPLLIALLGEGRRNIGRQTGLAYAWNTGGAIVGSLAGGFGLLPLLTAPGTWRAVVLILGALGVAAAVLSTRFEKGWAGLVLPLGAVALAVLLAMWPVGPTAGWRHSSIGAGRSRMALSNSTALRDSLHLMRRSIVWEADGVESSVGLSAEHAYAFIVNGKVDGHAIGDASTQVMMGMVSAVLHPDPRRSVVIGMGTGSSAGWLAQIGSMERVDVVELEPAILEVARRCAPVNANALENAKVNVIIGDGREVLLTAPNQYDLIVSEPSNPYRAGVATLFTKEFYDAVAKRLGENGIFTQWLQAYEIDAQTIQTIYATLTSVFSHVETWQTNTNNLLLLCSQTPVECSASELGQRIQGEPFRSALRWAWGAIDVEGFMARFVANADFAQNVAKGARRLNTDDKTVVEYGFARTLGRENLFSIEDLRSIARAYGQDRPSITDGDVRWDVVNELRFHMFETPFKLPQDLPADAAARLKSFICFLSGDLPGVLREWCAQSKEPVYPLEVLMVAEAMVAGGNDVALPMLRKANGFESTEAWALRARWHWDRHEDEEAVKALAEAFTRYRQDPWPNSSVMIRALQLAETIAVANRVAIDPLMESFREPFAVCCLDEMRRGAAFTIASQAGYEYAVPYVEAFEPDVPWNYIFLKYRYDCYRATGHRLEESAQKDLARILKEMPQPLYLPPPPGQSGESQKTAAPE